MHLPSMTTSRTNRNPHMEDSKTPMDHWRCILTYQGRRMTVIYSMGLGHHGKAPQVEEVLDCLFADASAGMYDFEPFCADMGYSPDSRTAERIHKACKSTDIRLHKLLGADYEALEAFIREAQ